MDTVNVKFDWNVPSTKENKGHNQGEWGKCRQREPYYLTSYKIKWE